MIQMIRRLLLALILLLAIRPAVHAQSAEGAMLELVPLSGAPIRIDAAQWAGLPRDTVQAADAGGANHAPIRGEYAGVPMRALLTLMGVPEGTAVRGPALRLYVVAEASDGYRVIFTIPELDPGFTDAPVIVADRHQGAALSEHEGPLRIIAPNEKRPGRWVRNLVRVSVREAL